MNEAIFIFIMGCVCCFCPLTLSKNRIVGIAGLTIQLTGIAILLSLFVINIMINKTPLQLW
jgi:hypothetical protein